MALLHRSSHTPTDEPVTDEPVTDEPVTDVMASNAVVTPTDETPIRVTKYIGAPVVQSVVRIPVASFGIAVAAFLALFVRRGQELFPSSVRRSDSRRTAHHRGHGTKSTRSAHSRRV
jgi:hypothetical protein